MYKRQALMWGEEGSPLRPEIAFPLDEMCIRDSYKAKVDYKLLNETQAQDGKLILVTAITPTPAGEGKTTTSVGLADGLRKPVSYTHLERISPPD